VQGPDLVEILRSRNILLILAFTLLAIAVMGYHPGFEDDGIYLTAVKSDLNPALYPHDAAFFRLQSQATVFDKVVAAFIRTTRMPVDAAELLIQFAAILLIIAACWVIARKLFAEERARWAGVAMVAAMLTLPVSGSALNLADQHLHPRNIATGFILAAVSCILAGKRRQAVPLLALAFLFHPIMAALGISFCFFLALSMADRRRMWPRSGELSLAAAAPLGWVFTAPTPEWRRALGTRTYYFLFKWAWYEWLGAVGPLVLFWLLWRIARKRGESTLARFSLAVVSYGAFQLAVAIIINATPALARLLPLQPMRFLHLVYFFMTLVAGGLIGKHLLRASVWRWVAFLVLVNAGMFASQRALVPSSDHLELPGRQSSNPWQQAFTWIRQNTPVTAYFALDPYYLSAPGEDFHSFRALAERSQLADGIKDPAVVTQVPVLGPEWSRQISAQAGWDRFTLADFERLKAEFGVDWVLVSYPGPAGLNCPWHNSGLSVCEIPWNPGNNRIHGRHIINTENTFLFVIL
jgi:hypothetical protein